MTALAADVLAFIRTRRLLPDGQRIVVAVSGGLDSVVLLRLLAGAAMHRRWRLTVAHYNHRLRGRAATADQAFVVRLARRLGLACVTGGADVLRESRQTGESLEMTARRLRYAFLLQTAKQVGARRIALAHHADDQVEQFFLRLLRGAGPEGLAGIRPASPWGKDRAIQLVRPLLEQSRGALKRHALEEGWHWREDRTNHQLHALRNRVRHELLPLLENGYQPALRSVVLRAMELLRAESDWMEAQAGEWDRRNRSVREGAFLALPVALQRRIVRRRLFAVGLEADFGLVESLLRAPGSPIAVGAKGRVVLERSGEVRISPVPLLSFESHSVVAKLTGSRGSVELDGRRVTWRLARCTGAGEWKQGRRVRRELLDADRVGDQIILRHWVPGDRFRPMGYPVDAKLQDLFTSAKIAATDRRNLLVATTRVGQVFWVEGLRIGEEFRLSSGTRRKLEWRWR